MTRAAQPLQPAEDVIGHGDGVGALALGNRNRDGGKEPLPSEKRTYCDGSSPPSVTSATSRTKMVLSPVPGGNSGDDVANIVGGAQELAGLQNKLLVAAGELARGQAAIGKTQRSRDLGRR